MRRRLATSLVVASTLVLLATPLAVWATLPRQDVGSIPKADRGPRAAVAIAEPPSAIPSPSAAIPTSAIEVRSARLEDHDPPRLGPRPVELSIEAIDVHAPIVAVGIEVGTRDVEVPADVDTVGWYRFGPSPGAGGSAVLLGHVDSRTQGFGVFFRLRELEPGDLVRVGFADGTGSTFRVVARRSYAKGRLPAMLFQRDGQPMLTLVTCGGSFEETTRSYSDNVVVFAVPRG